VTEVIYQLSLLRNGANLIVELRIIKCHVCFCALSLLFWRGGDMGHQDLSRNVAPAKVVDLHLPVQ